jgi:two-component system, OmpR family, response regulator
MIDNGHILVVDDEREICTLVQGYLSSEGYRVSTAQDGADMRRVIAQSPVDLVILDLMLPGEDGLTLARWLRENFPIGIIMLTGRGEVIDRILGLEMGANYYVPKPFYPRELLATVRSVLRGASAQITGKKTLARSRARFAGWTFNLSSRELFSPLCKEVRLTTAEFDLLTALVQNPNRVIARDELLDRSRNRQADRTVDALVGQLRCKLEDDMKKPTIIKTVYRRGYIFTREVEWF